MVIRRRGPAFFARLRRAAPVPRRRAPWFVHAPVPGLGDYLRWASLFEFFVSTDGRTIAARPLGRGSKDALSAYLLGQVLSMALVRQGVDPLHATAVVVGGRGVAFLGDCGYGKSTLGAAFLRQGCPVLTDDLFVVAATPEGPVAYPGPPRIKLFPEGAARLLARRAGARMNRLTRKLVLPLAPGSACPAPVPLAAIFALRAPQSTARRVTVRRLSAREACLALVRNTFNTLIVDPERLQRQLDASTWLARNVPVFALSYPRRFAWLPAVVGAVTRHVAGAAGAEMAAAADA